MQAEQFAPGTPSDLNELALQRSEVYDLLDQKLSIGLVVDKHSVESYPAAEEPFLAQGGLGVFTTQFSDGGMVIGLRRAVPSALKGPLMKICDLLLARRIIRWVSWHRTPPFGHSRNLPQPVPTISLHVETICLH